MNIGERIRQIAKEKGISAQNLGEAIGRKRQWVYDIYNGRISVNVDQLLKIARVLNEPIGNFLITNPDAYYDMIPYVIPIQEILKLSEQIQLHAKIGEGMVHLRIFKTPDGMYIMESEFRSLKIKIEEETISKFEANVKKSKETCFSEISDE